ncbi:unnamed protein product [Pieris brassicae]|uniref:Uncharacterized protein n=1 Tax=Pieris brassicae TaxID=7116 RepID=A0A9P0X682_PIEBR|nr:unnamed protein product [Pieris brassicae]
MGNQKSQEVVVAQNAASGINQATADQIQWHMSTTNILLMIISLCIFMGMLYFAYTLYKKCIRWISRQTNRAALRTSFFCRPAETSGCLEGDAQARAPNKLYPGVV